MKFATYFEKTQIPEWKKAYIDYVGLKRIIKALAAEKELNEQDESPFSSSQDPELVGSSEGSNFYDAVGSHGQSSFAFEGGSRMRFGSGEGASNATINATEDQPMLSRHPSSSGLPTTGSGSLPRPIPNRAYTDHHPGLIRHLRRRTTTLKVFKRTLSNRTISDKRPALPLAVILPHFTPHKLRFYKKLEIEVAKVEEFYSTKETEFTERAEMLQLQFQELIEHHGRVQEARDDHKRWMAIFGETQNGFFKNLAEIPKRRTKRRNQKLAERVAHEFNENVMDGDGNQLASANKSKRASYDEYRTARKRLKKAIVEHYRGLELLNNYRILNLTGIRKALQKFEWVTEDRSLQNAFMEEKVDTCSFASGKTLEALLKEAEEYYTARFARGDVKQAYHRLRVSKDKKTYYWSATFSAICIGLAMPVLIHGIYLSFQRELRESIPWDALLYVYATLFVPTIFLLLIGVNLGVWVDNRINYQFIFELDVRTQLDYREYFKIPSFLFLTLSYALWFSFNQVGANHIAPTTWPLAWLVLAVLILVNPFPFFSRGARYWFLRKVGRLLAAGSLPVEFPDFWIGDQLCSQTFALSNLYFFGCAYSEHWDDVWDKCSSTQNWVAPFLISVIPFACRGLQSIRRYADTGLVTHLVNAGKYAIGVGYVLFNNLWKGHGRAYDFTLICYIVFATTYSLYATYWDLSMDWSLFNRKARYHFLRKELVYATGRGHLVYYLAMALDLLIRFHWIMYIPSTNSSSFSYYIRSFIGAILEIIRRWQWNFFRLENEHIGNTDQYRVTREVPLPYEVTNANDVGSGEEEEEDDNDNDDEEEEERGSNNDNCEECGNNNDNDKEGRVKKPSLGGSVKDGFRRRSSRVVQFFGSGVGGDGGGNEGSGNGNEKGNGIGGGKKEEP